MPDKNVKILMVLIWKELLQVNRKITNSRIEKWAKENCQRSNASVWPISPMTKDTR